MSEYYFQDQPTVDGSTCQGSDHLQEQGHAPVELFLTARITTSHVYTLRTVRRTTYLTIESQQGYGTTPLYKTHGIR